MTTDGHQSIAAISTDEHHHPRNADLDITATCEQLDQNLSDVELEEMGPQQKPTYSRFVILLEPTMFLCALYIGAIFPVVDQYVRARISNEFNLTDNYNNKSDILGSCSNNSNYYKDDEVNSEASLWTLYSTVASLLPGIVTLILLGSYSDKGGRKIAIIVPQVGALIRCINLLAVIYFDWPLYFIVIGAFLEGLSGGIYMTISAGFSYVADITSLEKRSFRITILDGCFGLGIMVSQVAAGYLIASLGYFYLFLILAIIILLDIVIVACFLPETVTRDQNAQFWSIGHFRTAFNLYCRDNGTGRRWKLLLSLAIVFFTCSVMYATFDIQTFYLLDVPFCMSSVLIGYFGAMLMLISAPFSMLMSKWTLSVFGDSGLLLIGAVSSTAYQAVVTFSTTTFLVFMAPVAGAATNLVAQMVRAISSKLVSRDEEGTLFATISVAMLLSVIVGQLVFNNLYSATVFVWAPLTFLVMTGTLGFTTLLALVHIVKEKLEIRHKAHSDQAALIVNS